MAPYDFDTPLSIRNIWSRKWDYREQDTGVADVQPMWIADMDFETVPAVKQAIQQRAQLGIYGYTAVDPAYHEAVIAWQQRRHGWTIQDKWLVHTPSVVCAIQTAVRALTTPQDYILIQPPVYHPFFRIIRQTHRKQLESPLIDRGDHYEVDWADFEEKLKVYHPPIFILCSPHNPIGKVYTREELIRFGDLCRQYGTVLVADEIHGDLIADGETFVSYGTLGDAYLQNVILCTAPSKTFNLAGLHLSNIIIPNDTIRAKFQESFDEAGIAGPTVFALTAAHTAFRHGEPWLTELNHYLTENRRAAETFFKTRLPKLTVYQGQGTYFLWLDLRSLALTQDALEELLLQKAKIWANQGHIFGAPGYVRLNIALPRAQLLQALERLEKAIHPET